jgi:hypothetical protein
MGTYCIYMNQGLVADLRNHTLCSSEFGSCAPIVFYNKTYHIAGLYHLGGCDRLDSLQTEDLRNINARVNPTIIYVLKGGEGDGVTTKDMGATGPAGGHIGPVCALLARQTVKMELTFEGCYCFPSIRVSEENGKLKISDKLRPEQRSYLQTPGDIAALPRELAFFGDKRPGKFWRVGRS